MSNSGLVGLQQPPKQTHWAVLPTPGRYYPPNVMTGTGASSFINTGFLMWMPFVFPRSVTISAIGIQLDTAGSGGSGLCRLGMYQSLPVRSQYRPGALMLDAGTMDLTATTGWREIAVNLNLDANTLYWSAFVHDLTSTPKIWTPSSPTLVSWAGCKMGVSSIWPSGQGNNESYSWTVSGYGTGSLPANAPATLEPLYFNGPFSPAVCLKLSAVQ